MIRKDIFLILFLLTFPSLTFAFPGKAYMSLSGGYNEFQDITNPSTGVTQSSIVETDYNVSAKLGVAIQSAFILGFNYNINKWTQQTKDSGSSLELSYDFKSYGPVVGFLIKDSFHVLFTYYLSSEYDYIVGGSSTTSSTVHYSDGSGYQLDVGYGFKAGSFLIGPQVTYWHTKYKTRDAATGIAPAIDVEKGFTLFGLHVSALF